MFRPDIAHSSSEHKYCLYYEDQEVSDFKDVNPDNKVLGYYEDNDYTYLMTREHITTYQKYEKIKEEKIISPVNTEQMVMIEDDIICLIIDDCQYVLVNQVVQKL